MMQQVAREAIFVALVAPLPLTPIVAVVAMAVLAIATDVLQRPSVLEVRQRTVTAQFFELKPSSSMEDGKQ